MKKTATKPRPSKPAPHEYIPHTGDACDEGAARLRVVLEMLEEHQNRCGTHPDDQTNGYDICIIEETIQGVITLLRTSSAKALRDEEARKRAPAAQPTS